MQPEMPAAFALTDPGSLAISDDDLFHRSVHLNFIISLMRFVSFSDAVFFSILRFPGAACRKTG